MKDKKTYIIYTTVIICYIYIHSQLCTINPQFYKLTRVTYILNIQVS